MNPVLLLVHNCIELTKRCVESIRNQDIPTYLLVIDNSSTDGTFDWLRDNQIHTVLNETNEGVSASWNWGIDTIFKSAIGFDWVLFPNNDVVLPKWYYRTLIEFDIPFVTGISVNNMAQIAEPPPYKTKSPHPDFSGPLVRRDAWEAVGHFDPAMRMYAQDMDWHLRAHRAGVRLWGTNTGFYHERSSTLRLAAKEDRDAIQAQADADRKVFKEKWGVGANDPAYENLFTEATFGIDKK